MLINSSKNIFYTKHVIGVAIWIAKHSHSINLKELMESIMQYDIDIFYELGCFIIYNFFSLWLCDFIKWLRRNGMKYYGFYIDWISWWLWATYITVVSYTERLRKRKYFRSGESCAWVSHFMMTSDFHGAWRAMAV